MAGKPYKGAAREGGLQSLHCWRAARPLGTRSRCGAAV